MTWVDCEGREERGVCISWVQREREEAGRRGERELNAENTINGQGCEGEGRKKKKEVFKRRKKLAAWTFLGRKMGLE